MTAMPIRLKLNKNFNVRVLLLVELDDSKQIKDFGGFFKGVLGHSLPTKDKDKGGVGDIYRDIYRYMHIYIYIYIYIYIFIYIYIYV